jgi:hypothetical protein
MSIAQEDPTEAPDLLAQAGELLQRYQAGLYEPTRDTTIVLASAVLAVAAGLRDIHNVMVDLLEQNGAVSGAELARAEEMLYS